MKGKPLSDEQIELLVAQISLPDRQDECEALQVLLDEIRQAIEAENLDRAWEITLIAQTKAFATFLDSSEIEARAGAIRARLFGSAPARRRKPLSTRATIESGPQSGRASQN